MNFFDALNAHAAWKQRLCRHLDDPAGHPISATAAGRDDQCSLGRWLSEHAEESADLEELRQAHAALHREVEAVVRAAEEDADAAHALLEARFVPASARLQRLLRRHALEGLRAAG